MNRASDFGPRGAGAHFVVALSKSHLPCLVLVEPRKRWTDDRLQACHNFFVKKPKIFENVKSKRVAANFQKTDSARVSQNFQNFSDLRHKKHVCWINHYNEHDTTSFLSDYNESEVVFEIVEKLQLCY